MLRRLRAGWLTWRNRWLTDARFQQWASRFWLTRPFARRDTRALFDLCSGFVYSQVLFACVQLNLFETMAAAPRTAADLAAELGLPLAGADRLLKAAAALALVERLDNDRYTLGRLGAAALGNPAVAAMVTHHDRLYVDLTDPVALLRGQPRSTALADYWAYAGHDQPAQLAARQTLDYTELMGRSQAMIANQVLVAYPMGRHRRLLDIGGGDASFALAVTEAYPALQAQVFDLPSVIKRADRRIAAAPRHEARVSAVAGDFLRDAWPHGADLITLIRIVHDHDDAAVMALLRTARRALSDNGRLLIAEPMADTPGAEPVGAAYFGFYLLAMGQGRIRSATEIRAMLSAAGFAQSRVLATPVPLLARAVVAWGQIFD